MPLQTPRPAPWGDSRPGLDISLGSGNEASLIPNPHHAQALARDRDRPRMRLLDLKRIDRGALLARATVLLPSGLQISDIGIFQKDGRCWAQLPSEPMRDAEGQLLKD